MRASGFALAAAAALLALAPPVQATTFQLDVSGYFGPNDTLGGGALGVRTPFRMTGRFDGASGIPIDGPHAQMYLPFSLTLTVGSTTYGVLTGLQDPRGVNAFAFDQSSPDSGFPNRDGTIIRHYGIGFFGMSGVTNSNTGNPTSSGFIASYLGASTPFDLTTTGLVATTFETFYGVGWNSRPGAQMFLIDGSNTPLTLVLGAGTYNEGVAGKGCLPDSSCGNYNSDTLTQSNPLEYPLSGQNSITNQTLPDFTASLTPIPEPASLALLGLGAGGLLAVRRRFRAA